MQTIESIQHELGDLEAARENVQARLDLLGTAQPVSDEGRDQTRDELHKARVKLAAFRQRAAEGHRPSAQELAEAESDVYSLELSLMDDEGRESEAWQLSRTIEQIGSAYEAQFAELGERRFSNLGSVLAVAHMAVDEARAAAQHAIDLAELAEHDARQRALADLAAWPDLQQQARERFSTAKVKKSPVSNLYRSFLAFLDAVEAASGVVPAIVGRENSFLALQEVNWEALRSIATHGRGMIDQRWRARLEALQAEAQRRNI